MKTLTTAVATALLILAAATTAFAGNVRQKDIEIDQPISKAMIPGSQVAGGYMIIVNHGKAADRLLSASSPIAKMTQLHKMTVENDVMIMQEQKDGIEIPPGGTIVFGPGSYHVMFMDVAAPTKEGEVISAVLSFEKAGDIPVKFDVVSPRAEADQDQSQHMDMKMDMDDMKMDMNGNMKMDMPQ